MKWSKKIKNAVIVIISVLVLYHIPILMITFSADCDNDCRSLIYELNFKSGHRYRCSAYKYEGKYIIDMMTFAQTDKSRNKLLTEMRNNVIDFLDDNPEHILNSSQIVLDFSLGGTESIYVYNYDFSVEENTYELDAKDLSYIDNLYVNDIEDIEPFAFARVMRLYPVSEEYSDMNAFDDFQAAEHIYIHCCKENACYDYFRQLSDKYPSVELLQNQ